MTGPDMGMHRKARERLFRRGPRREPDDHYEAMPPTVEGDSTTAEVMLPPEEIEESLHDEIQQMVDHEAFQNPVKFMPDCHGGLGPQAIVGFSMKLGDRIVPNTVGGDIGCGMTAVSLDGVNIDFDDIDHLREVNKKVRNQIPMGTGQVNEQTPSFEHLYPFEHANSTLRYYFMFTGENVTEEEFDEVSFDMEYARDLFAKVGISEEYATNSLGSLGGGNHFIEVAEDSDGTYWVVVHSGSRNLGQRVKHHHQKRASELRSGEVAWDEMPDELSQFVRDDGTPDWEEIKKVYNGEMIAEIGNQIDAYSADPSRNTDLDYLEGDEMFDYLRDMMFAQEYATHNRLMMAREVANTLNAEITDYINSPHNYIDFTDGVIRKGSTRAHSAEQFVIPMNMEDGTLLCRGKGNSEWNYSAPHGAGRLGSRSWAHDEFDADEVRKRMYENGTYSANVPGDEVPEAYKDTALIEKHITPTAEVVDRLKPVMNFKA